MPDMLVKLYELPSLENATQALSLQGINIRRAMPYEQSRIIAWVKDLFGSGWADECASSLSNHPITCFIATRSGQILGFACHDATAKNFFGPTGVSPQARGLGIGKALLLACLHAMRWQGYGYAIIGGAGPTEFYEKAVGAAVIPGSSTGLYQDELEDLSTDDDGSSD